LSKNLAERTRLAPREALDVARDDIEVTCNETLSISTPTAAITYLTADNQQALLDWDAER
jgi:hypothetical protein